MFGDAKIGTKLWSENTPKSDLKSDGNKKVDVNDWEKHYGDKSLEDVLNSVSDPNWMSSKNKIEAHGSQDLDRNAFMKLMLTQLKHQDPTNPLNSHEMAAQLAQFTSVEELENINRTLESIQKQQEPTSNFQTLQLIGKKVSGDSAKFLHQRGEDEHEFNFDLPKDAQKITIKVRSLPNEEVIRTYEMNNVEKGNNKIVWDGLNKNSQDSQEGQYEFTIEAIGQDGGKMAIDTQFQGTISGVNYTPSGPLLLVGDKTIRINEIKTIENDNKFSEKPKSSNNKDITNLDLSDKSKQEDNKSIGQDILDKVAMSQAMKNKLIK